MYTAFFIFKILLPFAGLLIGILALCSLYWGISILFMSDKRYYSKGVYNASEPPQIVVGPIVILVGIAISVASVWVCEQAYNYNSPVKIRVPKALFDNIPKIKIETGNKNNG